MLVPKTTLVSLSGQKLTHLAARLSFVGPTYAKIPTVPRPHKTRLPAVSNCAPAFARKHGNAFTCEWQRNCCRTRWTPAECTKQRGEKVFGLRAGDPGRCGQCHRRTQSALAD